MESMAIVPVETTEQVVSVGSEWMEFIKKGDIKGMMQAVRNLQLDYLAMTGMFIAGVLVGVICTRYLKGIIFIVAVAVLAALAGECAGVLTIKWDLIHQLLGSTPQQVTTSLTTTVYEWVTHNISLVISAVIGFFIGLKVG